MSERKWKWLYCNELVCFCAYSSRTQDKKGATRKWKWRYCHELVQFAFSSPHLMKQNSGQQGQYGKKGERSRFRRDFKTSSKIDGESLIFLCEIWGKQKLTGEKNLQNYKTSIKFLSIMFWSFLKRFHILKLWNPDLHLASLPNGAWMRTTRADSTEAQNFNWIFFPEIWRIFLLWDLWKPWF